MGRRVAERGGDLRQQALGLGDPIRPAIRAASA